MSVPGAEGHAGWRLRAGWLASVAVAAPAEARLAFAPPEALARRRDARIRDAVALAYDSVEHYREAFDAAGLKPADINGLADFDRMPLLERTSLASDEEGLRSRRPPPGGSITIRTSGSSGTSVVVHQDQRSMLSTLGPRLRWESVSREIGVRSLGARRLVINNEDAFPLRRRQHARGKGGKPAGDRRVRVISNFERPGDAIAELDEFKPHVIKSFGSRIELIFELAARSGREFHRPQLAAFSGDAISAAGRERLDELGIPVLGYYGAAEAPHIGFECTAHRGYHVNADIFPIRIVDADGRELPPGEEGEVAISNLLQRDTVLLNYRLGDRATMLDGPCPCGRTLPTVSFIEGRTDDWLVAADGELIHPQVMTTLVRGEKGIGRFQFRQRDRGRIEMALTGNPPDLEALEGRIRDGVNERLQSRFEVSLVREAEIPRSASGKVRSVVSEVSGSSEAGAALDRSGSR